MGWTWEGTENLNWPAAWQFLVAKGATSGKTVNFKYWRVPSLSIRFCIFFLKCYLVTATHASQTESFALLSRTDESPSGFPGSFSAVRTRHKSQQGEKL